jgi:hypothetical protein
MKKLLSLAAAAFFLAACSSSPTVADSGDGASATNQAKPRNCREDAVTGSNIGRRCS